MTEQQERFLYKLASFIDEVQDMPRFKGQAKAVRALKRIRNLSDFN